MHALSWSIILNGLIGIAAVALLLAPAPASWVAGKLAKDGVGGDDGTLTAVRGAMVRMSYVGALTFGLVVVVGLTLQLKAVSAAVALAFAVVASASVRVDGGVHRSARLNGDHQAQQGAGRLLVAATALAVLVIVSALLLAGAFRAQAVPQGGPPDFGFGPALPDVTTYSLPILAGLSLALVVAGWLGIARVRNRPTLTAPDTGADALLRAVAARRVAVGVLGGQIVLLGITVSAVPVLAPSGDAAEPQWVVDPSLADTAATWALVVIAVGLLVVAGGLVASWAAPRLGTPEVPEPVSVSRGR